jgi:hypothetical protein
VEAKLLGQLAACGNAASFCLGHSGRGYPEQPICPYREGAAIQRRFSKGGVCARIGKRPWRVLEYDGHRSPTDKPMRPPHEERPENSYVHANPD